MTNQKINKIFHSIADQGSDITDYRRYHRQLSKLPAKRIEIILQLAKLKKEFLNNKL
jgi:hypothetical protein